MADTSIRLSEEAKSRLDLHKRDDESYEDVIMRLTERDRWAAFGIAGDGVVDGMERAREDARERGAERSEEFEN